MIDIPVTLDVRIDPEAEVVVTRDFLRSLYGLVATFPCDEPRPGSCTVCDLYELLVPEATVAR